MCLAGAYSAERAAALSGIPQGTLLRWARDEILPPSVSPGRMGLWSYTDLLALRFIYWLRKRNTDRFGSKMPRLRTPAVPRALAQLRTLSKPVSSLLIDIKGEILGSAEATDGRVVSDDMLDLIAPFTTPDETRGPDLLHPRRTLSIVPGKLAGSPHVEHSRLEARALAQLRRDGLSLESIRELYLYLNDEQISDALELEDQLMKNLSCRTAT